MDFSAGGWWIVDDTGFPKQGQHSVGVARQYCGMLGKQDNCQVAVSVTLACQAGSLPVAWQLYLPKEWAEDLPRRDKAGVPEDVEFATKPAIALAQIEQLMAAGCAQALRAGRCRLWRGDGVSRTPERIGPALRGGRDGPGDGVAARARAAAARAVPRTRQRAHPAAPGRCQAPASAVGQGAGLGTAPPQWQTLEWREGTNFTLRSRFARVRVRAAHRDQQRSQVRPQEWLLIEWPEGDREPMKYWLSTLPEDTPLQRMVFEAKMRWRIERDYQDLKQELGLGHYEGRGWRGFHHHASLSIAAYGFLMAQQLRHPEGAGKKNAARGEEPALPTHYKPRGSPAHAAPRPIVHHDFAAAYRRSLARRRYPDARVACAQTQGFACDTVRLGVLVDTSRATGPGRAARPSWHEVLRICPVARIQPLIGAMPYLSRPLWLSLFWQVAAWLVLGLRSKSGVVACLPL